ncbi:MAG: NAD-dependent succinate-semialdehyde dehydrogenase [Myxococcota bacterium]
MDRRDGLDPQAWGLFIDGAWRPAGDAGECPLVDPATEEPLGRVPMATPADVDAALDAAERGFETWRRTPPYERSACLRAIGAGLRRHGEAVAERVTREVGKPLVESRAEVLASAEQFEWNAEEARRLHGEVLAGREPGVRLEVRWAPVGVVAALTAWNFPALLPARKLAPALAAGCSVVLKPSEEAPGAAFAIAAIAEEAGLPPGVLGVVTGDPPALSGQLLASDRVRKLTFTGSVPVGKQLMAQASQHLTKLSLELGGHAPVLVLPDADPRAAALACARAKFRNAGQVCVSPSRLFVHRQVVEPFQETMASLARGLRVGSGLEEGVEMGPLANPRRLEAARELVEDALACGAKLLAGGGRPASQPHGYFFSPTVLAEVPADARMLREEPFVPVAPILPFDDLDEAVARANALPFGLAAYAFTRDLAQAERLTEELEAGMVGVNDLALAAAEIPFGGVKESGIGRESGRLGIFEFLESRTLKTVF